jgi:hypothetical protein
MEAPRLLPTLHGSPAATEWFFTKLRRRTHTDSDASRRESTACNAIDPTVNEVNKVNKVPPPLDLPLTPHDRFERASPAVPMIAGIR